MTKNPDKQAVDYSSSEKRMLELLISRASRREVASTELIDEWYDGTGGMPYHGREIVTGLINSLRKKLDHNLDKYAIVKSKRAGPHPIKVRLTRRAS